MLETVQLRKRAQICQLLVDTLWFWPPLNTWYSFECVANSSELSHRIKRSAHKVSSRPSCTYNRMPINYLVCAESAGG